MEKKLAVIVDNKKEVTTEGVNTELCSSACDVAKETCSSQSHATCGDCGIITERKVEAATEIGIHALHFQTKEEIEEKLRSLGVEL